LSVERTKTPLPCEFDPVSQVEESMKSFLRILYDRREKPGIIPQQRKEDMAPTDVQSASPAISRLNPEKVGKK
jgi:hypothetical protein